MAAERSQFAMLLLTTVAIMASTSAENLLGGVTSSNSSESTDLKTTLSSWSTNTTKLNGFCKVMNTKAGPCIETLLPALISLLESDAMCCHELNGYLEVLKLLNDVCSSLETTSLASGLASGASIPYYAASCCASGLSKFLQSLDSVMTHLSGNSMAELFTLITGRQNASMCTSPNFTLSVSNTSSNATTTWSSRDAVNSKTRSPKNVTCTLVKLCDSNSVCSEVCEAGTASIDPWVVDTIAYQNEMSYAETLCYTQLPATHNSVITQARGYGNRDQLFNAMLNASNPDSYTRTSNQFLSLTDQLNVGARFLELDVHYFASALRDAHCSNLGVSLIDTLSADMVISLKSVLEASGEGSTVEWSSDLVGCLPSLSGIRAEEQRLHNESLAEIATWLASHPNDFVVLFADIGDEVASFGQTDALLKLYANTFGDLLFSPSDFESAGGDWNRFTLEDLIQQGKHVVLVTASEATTSEETRWGRRIVRAFESELHYATSVRESFGGGNKTADTPAQPANVNASSLPVFVEAGVNFVAPDGLDGATMASMLSGVDGRWHGVVDPSTISNVACVSNSSRMTWKVVAKVENAALLSVLRLEAGAATAQLDVELSSLSSGKMTTQLNVNAPALPPVV
ncbi:PLC-like phosphodiesterase, TIM beta/alpha-barrel domain [Phytophthora cactorum]|nr:PLC-like phosphodiesterase, TIM beta/alpha-barrel domain [Phytophthora cactorum]